MIYYGYTFLIYILLCCLPLHSNAQIVVDGDLSDWDTTRFSYDDQNKLWYDFRKDQDFLYIALLKNENAGKIYIGGVQLYFDHKEVAEDSFRITFAHRLQDVYTGKYVLRNHDFIELVNTDEQQPQVLPLYNDTGILAIWNLTDSKKYAVIEGSNTFDMEIPNPNIFKAEIHIPLSYFKHYENTVNYSICLRGNDLDKKGKEAFEGRRLFHGDMIRSAYIQELIDINHYTVFFGTLDLESL